MLQRAEQKLSRLMTPRDHYGRPLQHLRLSVTDRCNFRCGYCMPESSLKRSNPFLSKGELLNDRELTRLVGAFAALGVTNVRLTGGEPLLRPGFPTLVRRISKIPGIEDISMTTNGVLLPRLAHDLKESGLNRVTVSLDSLDETVFARVSGGRGSAAATLAGIAAAEAAGYDNLKINCVVQRGVNDHTVMDLVRHFRGSGHIVRLIEFLDVGNSNEWRGDQVVPGHEWVKRIHDRWPLRPLDKNQPGETAQRYAYADGKGEIGLINSITQPFCGNCSRARVTADGKLYGCLFTSKGMPLGPKLREHDDSHLLATFIRSQWAARNDRYSEVRHLQPASAGGLEMFRMGG
jgi:cyclic pyranopterin phosphate synthase